MVLADFLYVTLKSTEHKSNIKLAQVVGEFESKDLPSLMHLFPGDTTQESSPSARASDKHYPSASARWKNSSAKENRKSFTIFAG